MDTVVAGSEEVPEETSAFASALRMIMDIFGCFAILKRDDTQQAISEISERATHQPVHLRSVGMFKWIDELWSRIAYWLTFMCDDFAVYEFPSVYKVRSCLRVL
ncbi:unnamed protein product [Anisakis simplex]|uniref:Uncharacterized protein n=1 Tax=Anisakis simplex TaxID=6269 RepID=A0A0M3JHD6_ANISI|nr:unnamed protein product [Anisakis simplex]